MNAPLWDLRLGRWQDALADVGMVDAVITDPPYSPRVHEGQRTGTETAKATIHYEPLSEQLAHEFAAHWAPRVRWWAVVFSDHLGSRWWEAAWESQGWYVFSPVVWLRANATPRVSGDGPTSAVDYITIARPRHRMPSARMGSRRGAYSVDVGPWTIVHPGGKPVDGMRALIRDYTLDGDIVCDPHAGSGSTFLAASIEGHRSIGAEMDPVTYAKARRRLEAGHTPDLFAVAQ
jgi:DNA modification methylase